MSSSNTSLVLRVCRPDGTSHGGFQWPMQVGAEVVAPDWKNNAECGNGLHGWLYGQGDHTCVSYLEKKDAKWLVLEVESDGIVMLDGKCKFERCVVRFVGAMAEAAAYIAEHEQRASGVAIIGACKHVGDRECAAVNAFGASTAGEFGKATVGDRGTATAGRWGMATAGYKGAATAGDYGTATAGVCGQSIAGDYGTATAGEYGTATAGRCGTAAAGYKGTAIAGRCGKAIAGRCGKAIAGEKGELHIRYWDHVAERYRTAIAYVGEDGIKPNVAYKLDDNNKFVEASK